jgi:two-component system phosphate regulon response regulator PhoB
MCSQTMTLTPSKPKILIIDDQSAVLNTMIYLLKRVGCDAVGAGTGAEGMRMAREGAFDLITLDIDLPDISGLEICRRLKQNPRLCHIPVILISGRLCEANRPRCFELGAADYIIKPFDISVFVSRIFSHLRTAT